MAVWVKGGASTTWNLGSGGGSGTENAFPSKCRHKIQWLSIDFTRHLPFRIQYLNRTFCKRFSHPIVLHLLMSILYNQGHQGMVVLSRTGCFEEYGRFACAILPPHLWTPLGSRKILNCFFQVLKFLFCVNEDWDSSVHNLSASAESDKWLEPSLRVWMSTLANLTT